MLESIGAKSNFFRFWITVGAVVVVLSAALGVAGAVIVPDEFGAHK